MALIWKYEFYINSNTEQNIEMHKNLQRGKIFICNVLLEQLYLPAMIKNQNQTRPAMSFFSYECLDELHVKH